MPAALGRAAGRPCRSRNVCSTPSEIIPRTTTGRKAPGNGRALRRAFLAHFAVSRPIRRSATVAVAPFWEAATKRGPDTGSCAANPTQARLPVLPYFALAGALFGGLFLLDRGL